jgi:hypothetical protein
LGVARTLVASGGNAVDFVDTLIRHAAPDDARLKESGARALLHALKESFATGPNRDQFALCLAIQRILLQYWGLDPDMLSTFTNEDMALDALREQEGAILGETAYFDHEDGEFKIPRKVTDAERMFACWFGEWLRECDLPTECVLAAFGNAPFVLALLGLSLRHDDPDGCLAVRSIGKTLLAPHLPMWEDLRATMPESGTDTFTRLFVALNGIARDAKLGELSGANDHLLALNAVKIHKHCTQHSAHYLSAILNVLEMASHPGESDMALQDRVARLAMLPENVQDLMTTLFDGRTLKQYRKIILDLPGLDAAKNRVRQRLLVAETSVDPEARKEVQRAIHYIDNADFGAPTAEESPDA